MDDDPIGTIRQETFASGHSLWAYLSAHSPVWDDHKPRWVCIYSTHAGNIESDLAASDVGWLMENTSVIGAVPGTPAAAGLVAEPADDNPKELPGLLLRMADLLDALESVPASLRRCADIARIQAQWKPEGHASPAAPADDEAALRMARELWRQDYGPGTVFPEAGQRHDLYLSKVRFALAALRGEQ